MRRKDIFCPKCGTRVATYDGKSKTNIIAHCRKCNKRVIYHVDTEKVELKKIPPRNTISGLTFY